MAMFITKVWAFPTPAHPLLFGLHGRLETAQEELNEGDLVVCVASSSGKSTGVLLGVIEPTKEEVKSLDYIDPDKSDKRLFKENDEFKWLYGLAINEAREIQTEVYLKDIIKDKARMNQVHMPSVTGIAKLTREEEKEIRKLTEDYWEYAEVGEKLGQTKKSNTSPSAKVKSKRTGGGGGFSPRVKGYSVPNMKIGPGYTYCMAVTGGKLKRNVYKIGYSGNCNRRLYELNLHTLHDIKGIHYKLVHGMKQEWRTLKDANKMEKNVHGKLQQYRHGKKNEIYCAPFSKIKKAWAEAKAEMKK